MKEWRILPHYITLLAEALARGAGRAEVYAQWRTAEGPQIQGSPHLFAEGGYAAHNPGATFTWTGSPYEGGLPRLDDYSTAWADELLDTIHREG